ncbi:MAG: DUF5916 domain-containing protein [Thermoanaerobaculia bacterium]
MTRRIVLAVLVLCAPFARAANWPDRPTLTAVRATSAVRIDGDLSDTAWQSAPEFTDFTQHDPHDGEPGTMRTSLRVLYDDDAIYFGAKMEDPERPSALLGRRDTFLQYDFLSINIDTQHDRLSGNAFTVTPSDMQVDTILFNDIGEDISWDGVWESKCRIVADGWIAEVRIPFSQLRFPDKPSHTWGLNVTRRTVRNNEWVRIVNTPKGDTGFVSHFADLTGLEGIRRERPLEVVPYAVARADVLTRADRANPLIDSRDQRADAGLDLKYALTSTLTLTGTINPDFGQVEVDPAVVNLSQFETFYPERRPFFTEGLNIFAYGDSPARSHFNFFETPRVFYSRRIGRSPQGSIDADFVASPSDTTILGAAKVTGKIGRWSIGVLNALTDTERALFIDDDGDSARRHVEPMTNYFVTRATREIGDDSRVGFLVTSVNRQLAEELSALRENALTAGVDGYTQFAQKSWVLEWTGTMSRVSGSEEAIALTQSSSARYYQRPDANHVTFDPTRTALSGWSGRAMLSKNTGRWRPNVQVQAYSPGFETNDAGFMQRTDIISSHALMQYVNETPSKLFRERNTWIGVWQNRNFDGDTIERGAFVDAFGSLQSFWEYRGALFWSPGSFNDRLTRGGPIVRTQQSWTSDVSLGSDSRKRFFFTINCHFVGDGDGSYVHDGGITLSARPISNLLLSVQPYFSRSYDHVQYLFAQNDASATETYGRRYVFADLDQRSFELATRVDWTLNSRLSFQLYMQPFIASGDYHDYHSLVAARTADYTRYDGAVSDRDFNFRSVRGSAVVRWEFRPGSALYVVWNENRADVVPLGNLRINRDLRAISTAPSHDVFLVKVSYWLPL